MKKWIYVLISLIVVACGKDELTQNMTYENLYRIQDDPSDPVKHRVYELYEKFGVPVYFNDTIGKYYVKDDINGNPYYRYELLDLNWNFYSHNIDKVRYEIFYQSDVSRQMSSLDFVDSLLNDLSEPLYPSIIFLTDEVFSYEYNNVKEEEVTTLIRYALLFRLAVFTGLPDMTMGARDSLRDNVVRSLVKQKISNYSKDLTKFYAVTKSDWYERKWKDELGTADLYWYGPAIFQEWVKKQLMEGNKWDAPWTEEQVEAERDRVRLEIGAFGFVGGDSMFSPGSPSKDLDFFIAEAVGCDRAEFIRRWGNCPLVMKKYEILYEVLKTKLNYEL